MSNCIGQPTNSSRSVRLVGRGCFQSCLPVSCRAALFCCVVGLDGMEWPPLALRLLPKTLSDILYNHMKAVIF